MGFRNTSFTNHSGTITSAGVSQQVLAANSERNFLLIQNLSTSHHMHVGIGYTPSATSGIQINSNGGGVVFEDGAIPVEAINIFCSKKDEPFVALEG
jgi:hypothetical protein